MINAMFGAPQGMEWLVILVIVVLVFGAAKLPELARGTGQALRIFKTETKGLRDDEDDTSAPTVPPVALPSGSTSTPSSGAGSTAGSTAGAPVDPIVEPIVEPDISTDKHSG